MDGWQEINALPLIAAVVDMAGQFLFRKLDIAQLRPRLPPVFQGFGAAPVGGGDGIEHIVPGSIRDAVAAFIQHIFTPLLVAPLAVWLNGTDGTHHMEVGIGNAAIFLVRRMDGIVHDHAPAHKLLQQKLPCKCDVLLHGKLVLQGNVKAICKLGFLSTLHFLHGIPKGFPVCVLRRSVSGQQDFGTDHAALTGVVAVLPVVFAVELLTGTVSGCGNGGLSGTSLDLGHMKMKECDGQALPWSWAWIASASKL